MRQKTDEDVKLLQNRIRLLKQEEEKANKKITETQIKTIKIQEV